MSNWIKSLNDKAANENWCIKPTCTTCGSFVFRSNLIIECFKNNNLPFPNSLKPSKTRRSQKEYPLIVDLLANDQRKCIKLICVELCKLNEIEINKMQILRILFMEIYPKNTATMIKETLKNSPANKYLDSMEKHSKYVQDQYKRHEINNDPKIVEERRKIKKEFKAKMHELRVKKYKALGNLKNK